MRTHGRQAAIGATALALLLAATGSSLAAVRASRYDGGVASSGVALPAPAAGQPGSGSGTDLPPTVELPRGGPDGTSSPASTGVDPITGQPLPAADPTAVPPASAGSAGSGPSPGPGPASTSGSGRTVTNTSSGNRSLTVPTLGPAGAPTPTTGPSRPSAVVCPSERGIGALPVRIGQLKAVDFSLPWPALGPVVLVPQASAPRAADAAVRLIGSNAAGMADDGSSLTVTSNSMVEYSLRAGQDNARGSIRFTAVGRTENVDIQACRDRTFVLHDVRRGLLDGHPLRIVGFVATPGNLTIDPDGGIARFRAGSGSYKITLLTANDAGLGGPLVTASVTIP